ncbi:nucleotide-binding domain containing protein [Klebsiella pneumoniae]|uniref:nucleotide-binding domain containing protein n=1 Tax=Klebsiella pneumoniae TaxID=573 RepID=UPI00286DD89D|nr:nucleotide-binding domain containing protein [Klebsiella pneumoniae]
MFAGKKSAQIREILISESAWEEMTCLFAPSLNLQEEEQRFGLAHGEAAQNINHGLGSIVREVLNCASGEIKGLYMTGGDTMVNVLKELGATGIEMIDYVIPQTDMVRIIGGDYAGLICVGKGGLTGPEDIISIIVDRIYQEAQQ